MTADLGPTTLIPGSHRAGRPPQDESTWHGIAAPGRDGPRGRCLPVPGRHLARGLDELLGDDRRYMMQVHYGNQAIRKEYPAMRYEQLWNPDVIAQATPEQKQLLGG